MTIALMQALVTAIPTPIEMAVKMVIVVKTDGLNHKPLSVKDESLDLPELSGLNVQSAGSVPYKKDAAQRKLDWYQRLPQVHKAIHVVTRLHLLAIANVVLVMNAPHAIPRCNKPQARRCRSRLLRMRW
jgi:hypothetical protein